jgi:hypothetical protein
LGLAALLGAIVRVSASAALGQPRHLTIEPGSELFEAPAQRSHSVIQRLDLTLQEEESLFEIDHALLHRGDCTARGRGLFTIPPWRKAAANAYPT